MDPAHDRWELKEKATGNARDRKNRRSEIYFEMQI